MKHYLPQSEKRLHVRFETSELEHILATTDPREISRWEHDPKFAHIQHIVQKLLSFDRDMAGQVQRKAHLQQPASQKDLLPASQRATDTSHHQKINIVEERTHVAHKEKQE